MSNTGSVSASEPIMSSFDMSFNDILNLLTSHCQQKKTVWCNFPGDGRSACSTSSLAKKQPSRIHVLFGLLQKAYGTLADAMPLRFRGLQTLSPRRYCERPCSRQIMCNCR